VSPRRKLPPLTIGALWGGAIAFWVVQSLLHGRGGLALDDAILLTVLLTTMPALAIGQLPLMRGATVDRIPAYWGSILTLWFVATASWLVGTRDGGLAAIGVTAIGPLRLVAWSLGLTAAGLGVILGFRRLSLVLGLSEPGILRELLPRTGEERSVFAILAVAAGVGEEVAYRGYAILALAPLFGTGGAVVVSCAVFGVLHAYQGLIGVVRTAAMGGVLAWGFLASGSLIPPIIAHVAIDLLAGIVLADRLMLPEPRSGVDTEAASPFLDRD
jgi:membrane protease YdiL (CAAX protease family)